MGVENAQIVGEAQEAHSNPQVAEAVYEKKARSKNWVPLDEWRGDPEDWVPAKEFVQRQKLFDRIDNLKETIKRERAETESDMKVIAKSVAEMNQIAYERAISDLKAQRALAIEDRNTDAVEALDEKIDETKKKLAESKVEPKQKQAPKESPEFVEWREANSWFDTDTEMRDDAIAIGVGYSAKNPNSTEKDVYNYVTQKIQKMYSDKFGSKKKQDDDEDVKTESKEEKPSKKGANNVETGGGSRVNNSQSGRGKGKITVADLDDNAKQVMKTLIKRNVFADAAKKNNRTQEEEYLAQYSDRLGTNVR